MKSVMYHYVRPHNPALPNFRYLDIKNFRKQLDFFESSYGFVSPEEWGRYVQDGEMPERNGKVILTFDDAMSCHYDFVFSELKNRNLWGIFYVPTQPYICGVMLDVHRIHLLCGAFDGEELYELCQGIVTEEMIPFERREEFRTQTYARQDNHRGVSDFKRVLNYFVSYDFRTSVIDEVSSHLKYFDYDRGFYVDPSDLKLMADNGMMIGSHTASHPVMSKLSLKEQVAEIEQSFDFLDSLNLLKHRTYCHPYGGFHSFDSNTIAALNRLGVDYSFNVESREIQASDFLSSKQFLPRFDCNEFAHGKAS